MRLTRVSFFIAGVIATLFAMIAPLIAYGERFVTNLTRLAWVVHLGGSHSLRPRFPLLKFHFGRQILLLMNVSAGFNAVHLLRGLAMTVPRFLNATTVRLSTATLVIALTNQTGSHPAQNGHKWSAPDSFMLSGTRAGKCNLARS